MSEVLGGRYHIVSRIGEGGMARVYRAKDALLGRTVAVKVPHEQYAADPDFRQRLLQEARTAAGLSHPHVVGIFDVGESDGRPFIVMEYVEGPSLKEALRQGPLPAAQAMRIAIQICEALSAAHSRGIVHCDVKPQNVLLQSEPSSHSPAGGTPGTPRLSSSPNAKLTDFGIACSAAHGPARASGEVVGSVHYLAPERIRGEAATPASDLYSMGVVLYEMLAGRPPFAGETVVAIAEAHLQQAPPPLLRLNPAVPPSLERIVLRAMAREPESRWASCAEMGQVLRGLLDLSEGQTMTLPALGPAQPPVASPWIASARTALGSWLASPLRLGLAVLAAVGLLTLGLAYYQSYADSRAVVEAGAATVTVTPRPTTTATPRPTATPSPTSTPTTVPPTATRTTVKPTPTSTPSQKDDEDNDKDNSKGRTPKKR